MTDLMVVGRPLWDEVYHVRQMPKAGETASLSQGQKRVGGGGLNVARATTSYGLNVELVGRVGDDPEGQQIVHTLKAENVGIDHLQVQDTSTARCLILVDDQGERTILTHDPFDHELPAHLPRQQLQDTPLVFVRSPKETAGQLLSELTQTTRIGVFPRRDVAYYPADFLIGSPEELPPAGQDNPWAWGENITKGHLRTLILTRGVQGIQAFFKHRSPLYQPAYPVPQHEIQDTTGAGDSLTATLCIGLHQNWSIETILASGARWAAASIQTDRSSPVNWTRDFLVRSG